MKHSLLTQEIIKVFFDVYNELGYGFLERVYQNALYLALKNEGFRVQPQARIKVWFRGTEVGEYFADLVVDDTVIIELKAVEHLLPEHENQLLNYLRGTDKEVGLLLNFGPKPTICRKVYDNALKTHQSKSK